MAIRKSLVVLAVILCLSFGVAQSNKAFAEDAKLTPEQVIENHLKAIGSPEKLSEIQSRVFYGSSAVQFIQGFHGNLNDGDMVFASEKGKLGLVMKYKDVNYPGEYFAYDGNEVTVGYIKPGQRSPLADFIFRFNGVMKEGLIGGVLSVSWPLLDIQKNQPNLKYSVETVEGKKVHVIEYRPKKSINDVKVKLFFDFTTYRHVRTEYSVRIKEDYSAMPDGTGQTPDSSSLNSAMTDKERASLQGAAARAKTSAGTVQKPFESGSPGPISSTIGGQSPDSIYKLVENFGGFADVGGLMLPHAYTLDYSLEGRGASFLAHWDMKAGAYFTHNAQIGQEFFKAQK